MSATLVQTLTGDNACRREQQQPDVPDRSKAFARSIDGKELHAANHKGASWKQILNKAKEFTGDMTQQFAALKGWLEGDWRGNAKHADLTATAEESAPVRNKPAKKLRTSAAFSACGSAPSACVQLQSRELLQCPRRVCVCVCVCVCVQLQSRVAAPVAARSASDVMPPAACPPGALDALVRLVATRLPDARALQTDGVGDQLSNRLQRIENTAQGDSSNWLSRST